MDSRIREALNFDDVKTQASGSQESVTTVEFKILLKRAYGQSENYDPLFDMATGRYLLHSTVKASHIFQRQWKKVLSHFSELEDINHPCNGLLLYGPVEWAFDHAQLCVEIRDGCMSFLLLDKKLAKIKLTNKAIELQLKNKRPATLNQQEEGIQTTFGDLDGQAVFFPPSSQMRPSKRLLALHAYSSWVQASRSEPSSQIPYPIYDLSADGDLSGDEQTTVTLNTTINLWKSNVKKGRWESGSDQPDR